VIIAFTKYLSYQRTGEFTQIAYNEPAAIAYYQK
jgi:hypothetical protein